MRILETSNNILMIQSMHNQLLTELSHYCDVMNLFFSIMSDSNISPCKLEIQTITPVLLLYVCFQMALNNQYSMAKNE